MKTLLLTILTAFTFNANAGLPGSPIFEGEPILVDACIENVNEVASQFLGGAAVVGITRTFENLPEGLITYKVDFAPILGLPEGEPVLPLGVPTIPGQRGRPVLPTGVPTIPAPKGKPLGVPGGIIPPAPQNDSMIFIMEVEDGNLVDCTYFGSIKLN